MIKTTCSDHSQVHTEDTDSWVVLDTQVDVLLNTETEVSGLGEVPARVSPRPLPSFPQTHLFLNSYSLTFKARSRTSSAFGPRMVTWAAIFSFLRMENDRMVYRAFEVTGD